MFIEPLKSITKVIVTIIAFSLMAQVMVFADTPIQEKRIAIVIGNSAYPADRLTTAANDAGLIAQTLQVAGFDVVGARDLDSATLRATLREFIDKAAASGPETVAFVYFAGNAVQFEGENYLIPIDAVMTRDADIPIEGIKVSDVTRSLAGLPLKARMIVLDAARINQSGEASHPLSGGLALMEPEAGTLLAFNAAPGTISPYEKGPFGSYATALSEMIKAGGLSLNDVFDRTRLRVADLTLGTQLPWQKSRIDVPFVFLDKTADASTAETDHFVDLKTKPFIEFSVADAYQAALARDTLVAYEQFITAYPNDPLARRVRAIVAARREAATWHESVLGDRPDAYWSYLKRYPDGPHAYEARRRLNDLGAAINPPSATVEYAYDVAPPFEDELYYVARRRYLYLGDPSFDLIAPPILSLLFMPRRPAYFSNMRSPLLSRGLFMLPTPDYHPVQRGIEQPRYIAPPPPSAVTVDIHNTIIVNPVTKAPIVTTPAGVVVPLVPPPPPPAKPGQPVSVKAPIGGAVAVPVAVVPAMEVAIPKAVANQLPKSKLGPKSTPALMAPIEAMPKAKPQALPIVVAPPAEVPHALPSIAKPTAAPVAEPAAPATPLAASKPVLALPVPDATAPTLAKPAPLPSGVPALKAPTPDQPAKQPAKGLDAPQNAPKLLPDTPKAPVNGPKAPVPASPDTQAPKLQAPPVVQPAPVAPAAPAPKKPVACGHPGEPAC
jgi:uncharacterized caspase-like protein